MEDYIALRDYFISVINKDFVHFSNIRKWSITVFNNILVTKIGI